MAVLNFLSCSLKVANTALLLFVVTAGFLCLTGEELVVCEGETFRILFLNYYFVPVYINTLILEQTGTVYM